VVRSTEVVELMVVAVGIVHRTLVVAVEERVVCLVVENIAQSLSAIQVPVFAVVAMQGTVVVVREAVVRFAVERVD